MDYEFFVRLGLKGYRFAHIPFFLADFRVHTDSKSQRQALLQKEEMEKALFEQDGFLKQLDGPWRQRVRSLFMVMARGKRVILKFFRGAYFK